MSTLRNLTIHFSDANVSDSIANSLLRPVRTDLRLACAKFRFESYVCTSTGPDYCSQAAHPDVKAGILL